MRQFLFVLAVFCVASVLSGCPDPIRITPVYDYSNAAGLGTYNTGRYGPGSTFIWNIEKNVMQYVADLDLSESSRSETSGSLTSRTVGGVSAEGIPDSLTGSESIIEAKIAAASSFRAIDATRESFGGEISALSRYVGEMVDTGQDADLTFRPRDDRYRVVVIRSVVRARDTEIRVGGAAGDEDGKLLEIGVNTPAGEVVSVSVDASDTRTCKASAASATNPVCFFNVVVYDPTYVVGNPRLQWVLSDAFPADELPAAFRSLR
jgi:hypothetical protein